jgi:sugar-specific transcriptional regulator TrmB
MSDIDLLQKIGLSKYQALIYACLLRKGPLDARFLSGESQVPMGKIYETLSQLLINGIIIEHSGRPKKYEAIIPEIAFQRIYMKYYIEHEKQREDLKNTITQLEQGLERKIQTSPNLQDLQIMYSNEDILNYFIRIHNEAKKEVIYVTQIRYGSFNSEPDERTLYSLMNNLVSLLKRGIFVKIIYPNSPYLNFFSQIASCIQDDDTRQLYHDLVEIRVCNTEHNFILVDKTTCIFEPEDQRDLARPYAMIRIRDAVLNSQLRGVFQELWENAIPIGNE